jgi:ribose transport system substrate-binding protein
MKTGAMYNRAREIFKMELVIFRRLLALTVFTVLILPSNIAVGQPENSIIVAFVPGLADDPFYITLQSGIVQGFADVNAKVQLMTWSPTRFSADVQIPLLEEIVARGDADYLLVAPTDMERLIPVLERAYHAGIKIITVDTFVGDGDYASGSVTFPLTHIGSDDYTGGLIACNLLAEDLEEGARIYVQHAGSPDQRVAGCKAGAAAGGLEVVGVDDNSDEARMAQEQTAAILVTYPDLAGIFGANLSGAYGAGLAIQQAGLNGRVNVVAIDATADAVNLLNDGIITDIVSQKPFDMGYWAAVLAVAHARGYESIPKTVPVDYVSIHADTLDDPDVARYLYSDTLREPAPPLNDLTIAFVPGVYGDPPDPFYVTMPKGVENAVEVYGVHLVKQAPAHFSPEEQIPIVEQIIAENDIDYLITAPTDRDALIPILEQIHNSGIPIITVDTFIGDGDYEAGRVTFPLTYIGSDNVMGGYIGCSQLAMADILGTGAKIYIQNVRLGISTTDQRAEGCLAAAEDFELEVVQMDYSDNTVEVGREQTIQVLAEHPDIVGIFGTNVFSAQGAGAAVQDVGLGGIVEVVAFDATEFAIDLLRNGTVTQVIAQKPADMGYFAVLSAVAHARGIHSIPKRWSTGYEVINLNNVDDPDIARFIYREN